MHEDIVLTPMMKQFLDLKAKHPDAVMLFRCVALLEPKILVPKYPRPEVNDSTIPNVEKQN